MTDFEKYLSRTWKQIKFEVSYWWDHNMFRDAWTYVTRRFWERLESAWAHAKIGWGAFDWDSHYIHELLLFKLKRMQHNFIHYGHHCESCENYKPKMKSLALTIKLLDLYLNDHERYHKFYDKYTTNWGELDLLRNMEPADVDEDGYVRTYRSVSKSDASLSPEDLEKKHEELLEAFRKDERRKVRDVNLIHNIVAKYHGYWWD